MSILQAGKIGRGKASSGRNQCRFDRRRGIHRHPTRHSLMCDIKYDAGITLFILRRTENRQSRQTGHISKTQPTDPDRIT